MLRKKMHPATNRNTVSICREENVPNPPLMVDPIAAAIEYVPWKLPNRGISATISVKIAQLFMDTSIKPMPKPNAKLIGINQPNDGASGIIGNSKINTIAPYLVANLLPIFLIHDPTIGVATTVAKYTNNTARPSFPSSRFNLSSISGKKLFGRRIADV